MNFIKSFDLSNITKKFQLLYSIVLIDLIFNTLFINIMNYNESPLLFDGGIYFNSLIIVLIKGLIPAVLLYMLHDRMKEATSSQLKKSNLMIISILMFSFFVILFDSYILVTIL